MLRYIKAAQGILGLNARNLSYTLPENLAESRSIADNKLKAKRILSQAGITVPETYAVIGSEKKLQSFDWEKLPSSFALKPNKGFAGAGIIIVYGEKKRADVSEERRWIKSDGSTVGKEELSTHIIGILEGNFSLKNAPDKAYFEQRLKNASELKPFIYRGVPDVRVIVYNKIPIMAMLRLPTKESNGKANISIGAVAVGIDIASGITTIAVQHDREIDVHPDTRRPLSGISIPYWDKILEIAVKAQLATELGYAGVDVALDRELGPTLLEVNARPGLGIQIANSDGLYERLRRVKKLKIKTIKRAIRVSKELFGGEVEEEIETLSGKKIIGLTTKILLQGISDSIEVDAKVDTGASFSSIDDELAITLGYQDIISFFASLHLPKDMKRDQAKAFLKEHKAEIEAAYPAIKNHAIIKSSHGVSIRPIISLTSEVEGVRRTSEFTIIAREGLRYPVIIGARDLTSFIIDPTKII